MRRRRIGYAMVALGAALFAAATGAIAADVVWLGVTLGVVAELLLAAAVVTLAWPASSEQRHEPRHAASIDRLLIRDHSRGHR